MIMFYIIAAVIVFASLLVVSRVNPITSALWLVVCFFAQAVLFVIMGAHLVAVLQVLLYAGAIMVLILFVIMLLNLGPKNLKWRTIKGERLIVASGIIYFAGVLGLTIYNLKDIIVSDANVDGSVGTVESVGKLMLTTYAVPFELLSVLLLVAIVGAIIASKGKS